MNLIDELVDRWEELRDQGLTISAEELCADHPELLAEVLWQIRALEAIDSNFGFATPDTHTLRSADKDIYQPPAELQIFGRYRIEKCHAIGGLGQVFLAHDETLNRKVAIKFPKRPGMTAEQMARFEQEARITGQLDHPGIVPIHSLDISNVGEPCYVMRFVDGETLQQSVERILANRRGQLDRAYFQSDDLRHLLQAFAAVCNIVAYAHDRAILHRDIKPNNILIGPFGETLLLDWGIAKRMPVPGGVSPRAQHSLQASEALTDVSPIHTALGRALGTPAYASPEQTLASSTELEGTSDIYSLGAVLFYVVSGKAPLEATGWSSYLKLLQSPDAKLTNYLPMATPIGLREICNKALQIDPARRYQSTSELTADVDRFLAREPLSVLQENWWAKLGRMARKRPAATGAVVAAAFVCMLAMTAVSAIVNHKNRELSQGNFELRLALNDVESANEVALLALRGMVDEVVALKFAEEDRLSDNERSYIQSILQLYALFSELQNSSEHARSVQAEAYLQIGMMFYRLDQFDDAHPALKTAAQLLGELNAQTPSPKYLVDLSTAFINIATIEIERGDPDACLATTAQAAQVIDSSNVKLDAETAYLLDGDRAGLHRMRGEAFEVKSESTPAVLELGTALEILDRMFANQPDDISVQFAIGQVCRMMASNQSAIVGQSRENLQKALVFGDRSVDVLRQLTEKHNDAPRYKMALVWAHFDRAEVFETLENWDLAIADLVAAQDRASELSARFPLISAYRECQPQMLIRRGRLHTILNNLPDATSDFYQATIQLKEIVAQRPTNAATFDMLVLALLELAQLQLGLKQSSAAAQTLEDANAALEELANLNSARAQVLRPDLQRLMQEIASEL